MQGSNSKVSHPTRAGEEIAVRYAQRREPTIPTAAVRGATGMLAVNKMPDGTGPLFAVCQFGWMPTQ